MAKRKKEICNRDCFRCPYPDCILDAPMSEAEYREARERRNLGKTPEQIKIAAKKAAYRDAHREEIAAIRSLRKALHMSQTELGLRFGVSQSAVSMWETGRVSFDCERVFAWLHAEISATTE